MSVNLPTRIAILPDSGGAELPFAAELSAAITEAGGVVSLPGDADGLIWTDSREPELLRSTLAALPNVRWVQFVSAGIDDFVATVDGSRVWTSAKGCYARPIAEYVVAGLLAGLRNLPAYARARAWQKEPGRSLYGARVTIIGGGGIASAVVRLLVPFDCPVTVVRRSSAPLPGAARTVPSVALPEVLRHTDVLVLAAALTAQTRGIVDTAALARLPSDAWLVNVGRGQLVVTDALVAALRDGRLGGAVLDVTDPEPLPAAHALWSLNNVIVTPHVACPSMIGVPYLVARIRDNVARFRRGEPLLGLVDVVAGY